MTLAKGTTVKPLTLLHSTWNGFSPRERAGLRAAGLLLALFLLWSVALRPAWLTLQRAAAERIQALADTERLQALAAQATGLRTAAATAAAQGGAARPKAAAIDEASRALVASALGPSARLEPMGSAVMLSFEGVGGEQLRQGLKTLRVRWGALPVQAELTPEADGLRGRIRLQWAPD